MSKCLRNPATGSNQHILNKSILFFKATQIVLIITSNGKLYCDKLGYELKIK